LAGFNSSEYCWLVVRCVRFATLAVLTYLALSGQGSRQSVGPGWGLTTSLVESRHGAEIRHASRKKEGINPSRLIDGEKKRKKTLLLRYTTYAALLGTYLFYYKRCEAVQYDH